MPILDRLEAVLGAEIDEEKCPDEIAEKGEQRASDDEDHAAANREGVEVAEEKRDHEGGLQRTNAGARFVDSNITGADFDDVAHLHGRNPDRGQEFDVDERVDAHQSLDHDLFETRRPRHRDKKEQDRKREVAQPASAAGEINSGAGNEHRANRHRPTEQSPVRIRFLD